jgi:hypothetical protein
MSGSWKFVMGFDELNFWEAMCAIMDRIRAASALLDVHEMTEMMKVSGRRGMDK